MVMPDKFTGDGIVEKVDVISGDIGVPDAANALPAMSASI